MSIEIPKILKKSKCYYDRRGYLQEIYLRKNYDKEFKFSITTSSKKNVFRGLHFQLKNQQAKLVYVARGKILDIAVDLRKKSKTFGKSFFIELSEKNCKSLYIPEGFAHAYYSFSNLNIIYYKLSNYYHPEYEDGIIWNDKFLNINTLSDLEDAKKNLDKI